MKKKYCSVMVPNITAMMTGAYMFYITPKQVSLRYTDGTVETRKGKHSFKCYVEGDDIVDFEPFNIVSWVQGARHDS
jgi:hypothetical protein